MEDLGKMIYVGNLLPTASEDDLRRFFLLFGDLRSIQIVKDEKQRPKGFAYVEFEEAEDAEEAVFNTHEAEFSGRVIKVQIARKRPVPQDKAVWDSADYHQKYLDIERPSADN